MANETNLDIAVAGGGVAGIVAAYLLARHHRVTLYEKNSYVGGHTHTIEVDEGNGSAACVDTGFIVFNDRTYPNFIRFIKQLGVSRLQSAMSFTYWDPGMGFTYNTTRPFADKKNLLRPSFWRLLFEIDRFNKTTRRRLAQNRLAGMTLGQYLRQAGFSAALTQHYVTPVSAAIWSTGQRDILDFPAQTFARFFENHGLLSFSGQPRWYTIQGGSHAYVKAFLKTFPGTVHTGCPVKKIARENGRVRLWTHEAEATHDKVVIAAHADEALAMLADPSDAETKLLSAWQYAQNRVILHRDTSCLPPLQAAWGSWNYRQGAGKSQRGPATLTYYMNQLQQLASAKHYCVTLNPDYPIDPGHIIADLNYAHPMFDKDAAATQLHLPGLNGVNNTWFCGSYFRYGFHEDAVMSAAAVGHDFGIRL
ncbi:MAG: FAD-dependent oxidoreductase [Desulfosalsimonas sp.]|uniref:NAD(P)/FAD-dependent oxidoreductase n=1 Tax=Desulfosalsimonas sp. TaxID=3073848 RepID=UPI003970826B